MLGQAGGFEHIAGEVRQANVATTALLEGLNFR
jgi:hypothetical protein